MLLEILIATFVVFYLSLYARVLPDKVNCYWFAATIATGFLWLFCASYPLYILHNFLGVLSKKDMNKYSTGFGHLMMWTVRCLNPQLRLVRDYSKMKWNQVPSNAHIMFNHMSFWDSLNYTAEAPFDVIHTKKTLMKASLSKMPIAGSLFFKIMGHFPVYFASEKADEFGVDREKQEKVAKDIDHWINKEQRGLGYCPEGKMGSNPSVVQPLRYGMLKIIAATGSPVVVCTQWHNEKFWPIGEPFGGHAATIGMSLAEYKYKDGKEPLPMNGDQLDVAKYATDMQEFMQREVNRLKELMEKKGK